MKKKKKHLPRTAQSKKQQDSCVSLYRLKASVLIDVVVLIFCDCCVVYT